MYLEKYVSRNFREPPTRATNENSPTSFRVQHPMVLISGVLVQSICRHCFVSIDRKPWFLFPASIILEILRTGAPVAFNRYEREKKLITNVDKCFISISIFKEPTARLGQSPARRLRATRQATPGAKSNAMSLSTINPSKLSYRDASYKAFWPSGPRR